VVRPAQRIIAVVSTVRLFVYGSLMRGERHHAELKEAPFLGRAQTAPGYALETVGEYLALVERPASATAVSGELYQVQSGLLQELDEFEGQDYSRGRVVLSAPALGLETPAPALALETPESSYALAYFKRTR
jgi:gamma-glutamylcyclotransferase (GGCT)/AIG2-like uncharacterized protein YtfP